MASVENASAGPERPLRDGVPPGSGRGPWRRPRADPCADLRRAAVRKRRFGVHGVITRGPSGLAPRAYASPMETPGVALRTAAPRVVTITVVPAASRWTVVAHGGVSAVPVAVMSPPPSLQCGRGWGGRRGAGVCWLPGCGTFLPDSLQLSQQKGRDACPWDVLRRFFLAARLRQ